MTMPATILVASADIDAFQLPTAADERAELAALGVVLPDLQQPMGHGDLLAAGSDLLRQMGECDQEAAQLEEARRAEKARIDMRYGAQLEPIAKRRAALEGAALEVARRIEYGKKKSVTVGFGTLGSRKQPERVEIVDQTLAVAFARMELPAAIVVKESVSQKLIAPLVLDSVHANGDLPLGFEVHPARETFYATPEAL